MVVTVMEEIGGTKHLIFAIFFPVSGVAQEGEILAILGASGAGKTTLLNCLTFRRMGKLKLLGQRYLNGTAVNADSLARISGYVQQDDLFVGSLTVKETLRFQVKINLINHYRLSYKITFLSSLWPATVS